MRTTLIQAWTGFVTSLGSTAVAVNEINWFSIVQASLGIVAICITIVSGYYSIQVSRKALREKREQTD